MVPASNPLIDEISRLGPSDRRRRLLTVGRDMKDEPGLEQRIQELHAGSAFARDAALTLAVAAGRASHVRLATVDPSRHLRLRAARALPWMAGAEDIAPSFVEGLPADARKALLRAVAFRAPVAAEGLVEALATKSPHDAATALVACGASTVQRLLPVLGHRVGMWRMLVRRHPEAVLSWIEAEMKAAPSRAIRRVWRKFWAPLHHLAEFRGEATLDFVVRWAPVDTIPECVAGRIGSWTRAYPSKVFRLLMRPGYRAELVGQGLPRAVAREARHFSDKEMDSLAEALAESPYHLAALLKRLAPSRRAGPFEAARRASGKADVLWPDPLLEVLPHQVRHREVRRMLEWEHIKEDPARRLDLLRYLDLGTTRAELEADCRAGDVTVRATAYCRLINATGAQRGETTATLRFLEKGRAERDEVRFNILGSLADLPPRRFQEADAASLTSLLRAAADAQDLSHGTATAAGNFALRLLDVQADPALADVGLDAVVRLVRRTGQSVVSLERGRVAPGTADRVAKALLPVLEEFRRRGSHQTVLALTSGLDPAGQALATLDPFLEAATKSADTPQARQAIEYWLRPPRTREARIRSLLDEDRSVVEIWTILSHLSRCRPDWMVEVLLAPEVGGRFRQPDAPWAPEVHGSMDHWAPRQLEAYGARWRAFAVDADRDIGFRVAAIRAMSRTPDARARDFEGILGSGEVALVDAALTALGRLDDGTGVEGMLPSHLSGDHVHAAMAALRRRAWCMAPAARDELLHRSLAREDLKLAARKDLVLLLSVFGGEQNFRKVVALGNAETLHRDLRISAGVAARSFLPRPEAWSVLDRLAKSADLDEATSLLNQDPDLLGTEERLRYAALVAAVARHPHVNARHQAFSKFPEWSPGMEGVFADMASARIGDMTQGHDWRAAVSALVDTCIGGKGSKQLLGALRTLQDSPKESLFDATPRRDRPARQRLRALVEGVVDLHWVYRRHLVGLLDGMAGQLKDEPTLSAMEARVRAAAIFWDSADAGTRCLEMANDAEEEPSRVLEARDALDRELGRREANWAVEELLPVADALIVRSSRTGVAQVLGRRTPAAAYLALVLVTHAGKRAEWTEATASRLRTLRAHRDIGVRKAALEVFTCQE